ncbi:MAG: DUF4878 domain-containing protein [Bacteroidales bacterium]|nr:DUF4878 domain-containing protein [Bacteroidales bacterium]MBR4218028.1 DUF4878 domain-containing protein [Bacteroidales bacterium]
MKKCRFLLFALCAVLFAACGGPKPSDTACKYLDCLKDGKYEEAATLVYTSATDQDVTEVVELCKKIGAMVGEEGGINKYEVISEEIAEDGEHAVVKVKITYNDAKHDDGEPTEFKMIKVDKKWLIDLTDK